MNKVDEAVSVFDGGFVCSQAILSVYGEALGLDREMALKLAAGFGGGMAATGQTCGAVTGAIMVIGLAEGHASADDKVSKSKTYAAVARFIDDFKKMHGSVNCTELLGHDLGDPTAYQKAKKSGLFKTLCPKLVESAARIVEGVLKKDG